MLSNVRTGSCLEPTTKDVHQCLFTLFKLNILFDIIHIEGVSMHEYTFNHGRIDVIKVKCKVLHIDTFKCCVLTSRSY